MNTCGVCEFVKSMFNRPLENNRCKTKCCNPVNVVITIPNKDDNIDSKILKIAIQKLDEYIDYKDKSNNAFNTFAKIMLETNISNDDNIKLSNIRLNKNEEKFKEYDNEISNFKRTISL